jgi:hypothetical protein
MNTPSPHVKNSKSDLNKTLREEKEYNDALPEFPHIRLHN